MFSREDDGGKAGIIILIAAGTAASWSAAIAFLKEGKPIRMLD